MCPCPRQRGRLCSSYRGHMQEVWTLGHCAELSQLQEERDPMEGPQGVLFP